MLNLLKRRNDLPIMDKSINEILKEERIKAGLTQNQLAQKIGLNQKDIAKWEKDNENITIKSLLRYAKALDKKLSVRFF